MNISIIGTGYVGLVTGICLSDLGYSVTCVDVDPNKIKQINNKQAPIYEKDLPELLNRNSLKATTSYKESIPAADLIFICVGTPAKKDGTQNLSAINSVCQTLGPYLKQYQLVVVKSSVVPGTTEEIIIPWLEQYSKLKEGSDFHVATNPEFLREGNAIHDFFHPDRIIIGVNHQNAETLLNTLYNEDYFSAPLLITTRTTAEMIKYASNSFLATKISFINEIGNICKQLNINTYTVAEGMGYDTRIGREFLNAGAGWGGSCFPKDVNALKHKAEQLHLTPHLLNATIKVNEEQPLKLIDLLKKHQPDLKHKTIGILGAAFKPDTDDIRESRTIPVINALQNEQATIKLYDEQATDHLKTLYPDLTYCSTPQQALDADAVLLLTKWNTFEDLDYSNTLLIDGRYLTKAKNQAQTYEGICW